MPLPFTPPIAPMLAKLSSALPDAGRFAFEPKWDGFRALVFQEEDGVYVQSRDLKPLARYFPELRGPLREALGGSVVVDGEIVIARDGALDFEALLSRIHPAASRIDLLAGEVPASFVAFDLLADGDADLRGQPYVERRRRLEQRLPQPTMAMGPPPNVLLTPMTTDRGLAEDWFHRFEGAGFDGVVAKALDQPYRPGERAMVKVKHARTADCVVAGFRWWRRTGTSEVGSLLLGLFDDNGDLLHAGVCSGFSAKTRRALVEELAPLRPGAEEGHPWAAWAQRRDSTRRQPAAASRWSQGRDLSWVPLRPERVCEVAYDHLQGSRFRHATRFLRWRPDKPAAACRFDQLEATPPAELAAIFGSAARP